jgi:hypothetical protein
MIGQLTWDQPRVESPAFGSPALTDQGAEKAAAHVLGADPGKGSDRNRDELPGVEHPTIDSGLDGWHGVVRQAVRYEAL